MSRPVWLFAGFCVLLLAGIAAVVLPADDKSDGPSLPTTTVPVALAADVAELRAEIARLEREIVVGNTDQADIKRKVDRYIDRASRSTTRTTRPAQTSTARPAGDIWWQLALCESGGRNVATGNGYWGYFQFSLATWRGIGGSGYPHEHSYETQRAFAQKLQARSGWSQWPTCSRRLGLR